MIPSAARNFAATVRGKLLGVCASHRSRIRLSVAMGVIGVLTTPLPAKADPITVVIFGSAFAATAGGAVVSFVIASVLTYALSSLTNALFGPKNREVERQASVLQLSIGEVPREMVCGLVATGSGLNDAGNWVAKGKLCYDPRKASTGGSLNDPE